MMPRSSVDPTVSWLWFLIIVATYGLTAFVLITFGVDLGLRPPWWAPMVIVPLVAGVVGERLAGGRSLRGAGVAAVLCAVHVFLVVLTASVRSLVEWQPFSGALVEAAFGSATLSGGQLVFAVLALLPFRRMLVGRWRPTRPLRSTRTSSAALAAARPAWPIPPAPPTAAPVPASVPPPVAEETAVTVAAPAATGVADAARPVAAEPVEEVVRIAFERVAAQVPADAFALPVERVAATLLEPGVLLVPRRIVLPQLAEGFVQAPWSAVAHQFPRQARAISDAEIAARLPGGGLVLPLDEILRQLPSDVWSLSSTTMDIHGIEDFPPPFQPHVPPPQDEVVTAAPEVAPTVSREPEPPTVVAEASPVVAAVPEPLPAPAPVVAAVADPAPPVPPSIDVPPAPPPLMPLHSDTIVREGVALHMVYPPSVDRDAAAALAVRILPSLADPRLRVPCEQVTVRGDRFAAIVTPLGETAALVVAIDAPARLALLERWSLDAAGERRTAVGAASAARNGSRPCIVDGDVPARMRATTAILRSFGPLVPSLARDPDGGPPLYLFLPPGVPPQPVADAVRALVRALRTSGAMSVALRQDRGRLIVEPIRREGEAGTLVVGARAIPRPGLARLEVGRARRLLATD